MFLYFTHVTATGCVLKNKKTILFKILDSVTQHVTTKIPSTHCHGLYLYVVNSDLLRISEITYETRTYDTYHSLKSNIFSKCGFLDLKQLCTR